MNSIVSSIFILRRLRSCLLVIVFICLTGQKGKTQTLSQPTKPRIVITCDPELDDNNSLIRFLLYSNEMELEGLVYASSGYHWKGDGKGTKWFVPGREYARFGLDTCPCTSWRWAENERFIHAAVDAFEKVYPNLILHAQGYPRPADLRSRIRYGNIEFDGDISKDSPGSDLIKSLILDDKPGKLFLAAWGGHSTIARALKSIQEQYGNTNGWEMMKKKIARKLVLLPSGDQDDAYAKYIRPNWPAIEYRQFSGGPNYGYGAQLGAKPENAKYLTAEWMKENVTGRGPLGALYRVWGDGKQMVSGDRMDYFGIPDHTDEELRKMGYVVWMPVQARGSWIGEGDDHTFMNMLGNGLRAFEDASFGGWGGRSLTSQNTNANVAQMVLPESDTSAGALTALIGSANKNGSAKQAPFPDFFGAAQRDFAARMKWTVSNRFSLANHQPRIRVEGPLEILAGAGSTIRLNATIKDPDGNAVKLNWWQLQVGSYSGSVNITQPEGLQTRIQIPKDGQTGQTVHIIAEAVDQGQPALTSYQRIVIMIK